VTEYLDGQDEASLSTNAIDMDIAAIEDESLRRRIAAAFERLRVNADYGLVFEKHRPESVVLHGHKVREDRYATLHTTPGPEHAFRVVEIDGDKALLQPVDAHFRPQGARRTETLAALVPLARFGDPIFPGLVKTGDVPRGGDRPFHTVINGENFHALEMLLYAHRGKVDAIYIDPPYNTGSTEWKYNNDYVDADDWYTHSLWLSFMEKRLKLAKRLLNPQDSVLIVTIGDREVCRLGLLLESIFPAEDIEMVTTVINPRGKYRAGTFARSEEYIFFVMIGGASIAGEPDDDFSEGVMVPWRTLRRSDKASKRGSKKGGPAQFFPIYVDGEGRIAKIGERLPHDVPRTSAPQIPGCCAVFPIRDDDNETEMNWGLTAPRVRELLAKGYVRVGKATPSKPQTYEISYFTSGRINDIESGRASVVGRNFDGSVIARYVTHKMKMPTSTWVRASHNAEVYGSELLKSLLGDKIFDFPKSLYAVEDCLRLFIGGKPSALVLDFFGGSGTTAHAVMRLNRQDGGRRQAIIVTNNEVSADEQKHLRRLGLRPGDPDWESQGICNLITKPRIKAAITGDTPTGKAISGEYGFLDPFPMSEGFKENARFFDLTYLDPEVVESKQAFGQIAHLLWLMSGAEGPVIESEPGIGWALPDGATYGVLFRNKGRTGFAKALAETNHAAEPSRRVFIVADSNDEFHRSMQEIGVNAAHTTRLYRDYLRNFRTNVIDLQEQP